MTTNLTFKLTAAAALTFCSLALQAEETVQTSEVTVTAGRVEQQLLEVPMAVTVVTNQEIQESAARNVGELLEDIPGVMVNNAGSQGLKRVSIRGEDTFRTLLTARRFPNRNPCPALRFLSIRALLSALK